MFIYQLSISFYFIGKCFYVLHSVQIHRAKIKIIYDLRDMIYELFEDLKIR